MHQRHIFENLVSTSNLMEANRYLYTSFWKLFIVEDFISVLEVRKNGDRQPNSFKTQDVRKMLKMSNFLNCPESQAFSYEIS